MAVPKLGLDRPFTYLLDEQLEGGTGSLVSIPFHGRTVRGWVLGPAAEVPEGRLLRVRKVRGPVRFFDEQMLRLLRWVSERYIAPLSTVIERSHPPRVVGEESAFSARGLLTRGDPPASRVGREAGPPHATRPRGSGDVLVKYGGEGALVPGRTTWLRPLPREEVDVCVAAVAASVEAGQQALVLVPEADPIPFTARAVLEVFGDRAVSFLGGDPRERYRTWLEISTGRFDVVVGTRPAVFAPLVRPGLVWISREVHPGHREDRAPYYHVREVAGARARIEKMACVVASLSPSVETVAAAHAGEVNVARPPRAQERRAAPLVETAPPEPGDRSARLARLLKETRSAVLIVSRSGYGVARICRSCGEPAACAKCAGPIVVAGGAPTCPVCGAPGVCGVCGGRRFGLERGGTESVGEWAGRIAARLVEVEPAGGPEAALRAGHLVVGTAAAVKDAGPQDVDVVAILDPDRGLRRPGIHAGEQSVATWMEAAAWAAPAPEEVPGRAPSGRAPRSVSRRVLAQTRHPGHPALQALIRWEPTPFLLSEARTRTESGFPPNHPVFRIEGGPDLPGALRGGDGAPETILETTAEDRTVCLVAVPPARLALFRREAMRLAAEGVVTRVEAEPQL